MKNLLAWFLTNFYIDFVCVCVCLSMWVRACVFVCIRQRVYAHTYIRMHAHNYVLLLATYA